MAIRTISKDALGDLSDDHLGRQIETMRRLSRKRPSDFTQKVQTELCYLQREMEWRQKRRELHKVYMLKIT